MLYVQTTLLVICATLFLVLVMWIRGSASRNAYATVLAVAGGLLTCTGLLDSNRPDILLWQRALLVSAAVASVFAALALACSYSVITRGFDNPEGGEADG